LTGPIRWGPASPGVGRAGRRVAPVCLRVPSREGSQTPASQHRTHIGAASSLGVPKTSEVTQPGTPADHRRRPQPLPRIPPSRCPRSRRLALPGWDPGKASLSQPGRGGTPAAGVGGCRVGGCRVGGGVYLYPSVPTNGSNWGLGLANDDVAAVSQRAGRCCLLRAGLATRDRSPDAAAVAQPSGPIPAASVVAPGSLGPPWLPPALPGSGCRCRGSWGWRGAMLLEEAGFLRRAGREIPAPRWETCPGRAPRCEMGRKPCLRPIIHSFFFLAPTLGALLAVKETI